MEDKLLGIMGLARRAGRITAGFDAACRDAVAGKAKIILLTSDASENTAQRIRRVCVECGVPVVAIRSTTQELGNAIGRSMTAVAAITDKSFADRIMTLCRENGNYPG